MSDDQDEVWVEVGRFGAPVETGQYGLVLTAAGIDHRLIRDETGVVMYVAAADFGPARRELVAFAQENRRPYPKLPPARPLREGFPAVLIYAAVLAVVFQASYRNAFSLDWFSAGAVQAGLIANGEWWRALTALGLHADVAHLFGNLVVGGLFGMFLAQILGSGLSWLTIVLAGGVGNTLNALVQPAAHTAVGASTAVFAAVGILAVLMVKHQASPWKKGLRRWLPLAAGVTLLSFLGFSGVRTDIGAHLAGFAVGCLFGAGFLVAGQHPPTARNVQYLLGGLAVALFAGSWLLAFAASGA